MNLEPFHLVVACADRTGQRIVADVQIEAEGNRFQWHAILQGTGDPPAQLMGQADTMAEIEGLVCQRVGRIQAQGAIILTPTSVLGR